jgi:protein SCO1/2
MMAQNIPARIVALTALLFLAACGDKSFHASDITGAMPRLSFTMTRADDGRTVTAEDYRGKVTILYFGYTHCPDVCPTTLANLAETLRLLGKDRDRVRVLFVSVDPERDTIKSLRDYANAFAPEVDALTGSPNELARLARAYRVAYDVQHDAKGNVADVMHSDAVFFFDTSGRARLVSLDLSDSAKIAEDVKRLFS